jgi:hypothetical protein
MRPLDEQAAAEEEDPDVESAALCGEGGSVLRMLFDSDHLSELNVQKSIM